jgi:hypothetical protein
VRRLLGIFLFRWQVGDRYVSPFPGEGKRDRPADAGVAARDHRGTVVKPVTAAVRLLAVVGLVFHRVGLARVVDLVTISVRRCVLTGRVLAGVLVRRHKTALSWSL